MFFKLIIMLYLNIRFFKVNLDMLFYLRYLWKCFDILIKFCDLGRRYCYFNIIEKVVDEVWKGSGFFKFI